MQWMLKLVDASSMDRSICTSWDASLHAHRHEPEHEADDKDQACSSEEQRRLVEG